MSYQIKIIPCAQKDLDNLEGKVFEKIKRQILELSKNPRPYGSLKLTAQGGCRIRVGSMRILYRIDDSRKEIFVCPVRDELLNR